MSVKIFVLYHRKERLFETDALTPLQTGCLGKEHLEGCLHDDAGKNISAQNPLYAEMTGEYWVWKNWLPSCDADAYVGFCHYRRFLDFWSAAGGWDCFPRIATYEQFAEKRLGAYTEANILEAIAGYDVIVPGRCRFRKSTGSMRDQYCRYGHCVRDLEVASTALLELFPNYGPFLEQYLSGRSSYFCLNFVMRARLFDQFASWIFAILDASSRMTDWRTDGVPQKTPAYLAERFFNVWLAYQVNENGIRVLERDGLLLVPRQEYARVKIGSFVHRVASRFYNVM